MVLFSRNSIDFNRKKKTKKKLITSMNKMDVIEGYSFATQVLFLRFLSSSLGVVLVRVPLASESPYC